MINSKLNYKNTGNKSIIIQKQKMLSLLKNCKITLLEKKTNIKNIQKKKKTKRYIYKY